MPRSDREPVAQAEAPDRQRARRTATARADTVAPAATLGARLLEVQRSAATAGASGMARSPASGTRGAWSPAQLLALQRTAGNRAVQRLTRGDDPAPRSAPAALDIARRAGNRSLDPAVDASDAVAEPGDLAVSQVAASRSIQRNGDEDEASSEAEGEEVASPVEGLAAPSLSLDGDEDEAAQDEAETAVPSLGPLTFEDDEDEEFEGATLTWDNVAATFRTQNDRYTPDMLDIRGTRTIWHYSGGAARREEVEVTEESPAYWMTSGPAFGPPFIASTALKDMLTMDSTYTVTASGYTRYAPVNLVEDPEQVNFTQDRSFV